MTLSKVNLLYKNFGIALLFFIPLALFPKGALELNVNLFEYPQLIPFFKLITLLGDGWVLSIIFVFLIIRLFRSKSKTDLNTLLSFSIASLLVLAIVGVMKDYFFYHSYRPVKFFGMESLALEFEEAYGLNFHHIRSFPSGHTTTIALIGFHLMQYFKKKSHQILLFLMVLLVGFSRVFLFQHFVIDVLGGLFIGLGSVCAGNYIIALLTNKKEKYL